MKHPIIKVQMVSKFYGRVMGLNDITVDFGPGTTGLLGPNGAGKSTLIKLMTGQIRPSKGKVEVLGERPWDDPSLNARIGYCPEQDAFFKGMTGLRFVSFTARLMGYSQSKATVMAKAAIEKVGMTAAMDRDIQGYSKGMRQRIKLAQSLVHDPELLILDEPMSGTDPVGRVRMMEVLRDLEKEGKHIVLSSHILHEIERMTESIILIDKGKLVASGNMHDIRDSLDRFPLTVRIFTDERSRLAKLLMDATPMSSITFGENGNELLVRTPTPDLFYSAFQDCLVENRVKVTAIDSPDDNLNAIFEYLVG